MEPFEAIARARALLKEGSRRTLSLPERGVDIALHDWGGDGPLALLHHANGFCKGALALLAERLRAHYRVVAMDARGHGDSSHPEGAAAYHWDAFALDVLHVARALVAEPGTARSGRVALGFGHSFGGTALLGAAARAPELFERLVLLDPVTPSSQGATPERSARNRMLVEGARRRRARWDSIEDALARWSTRSLFASFHPVALALYALDGLRASNGGFELKCPGAVEAAVFENAATAKVEEHTRGLACKTHWLWARHGDFNRETYEALAGAMRDADITDLDAGHLVAMENPELVMRVLQKLQVPGVAR